MRKIVSIIVVSSLLTIASAMAKQDADVCRTRCRIDGGVICLERGPCAPENEYLLKTAKDCREEPVAKYMPITKLLFLDILSQVVRLDKEFAQIQEKKTWSSHSVTMTSASWLLRGRKLRAYLDGSDGAGHRGEHHFFRGYYSH